MGALNGCWATPIQVTGQYMKLEVKRSEAKPMKMRVQHLGVDGAFKGHLNLLAGL